MIPEMFRYYAIDYNVINYYVSDYYVIDDNVIENLPDFQLYQWIRRHLCQANEVDNVSIWSIPWHH